MSLYGNVKKIGSASFQFDRKYSNRVAMDAAAQLDGVYAGRYVLVEYGYRFGIDDEDLISNEAGQAVSSFPEGYKLINTEDGAVRVEGITENQAFKENAAIDLQTYGAVYDSTVWQKIYVNGKDKYIMVAELNAMAPKLDITQDTPLTYNALSHDLQNYRTAGIVTGTINERGELVETVRLTNAEEIYNKPYFDTALDTELTYLMHLPTTLNLEMDSNTIDFNENGFNIAYSYPEDEGVSTIAWIPKGHDANGNVIYLNNYQKKGDGNTDNGGNEFATLQGGPYPMDTKMLFMSFPALGNAMNALYNLLYGKPDPLDDLEHGAMRPYFKQFLDNIEMENRATVRDRENVLHYITYKTENGDEEYVPVTGKVGESIISTFGEFDALRYNNDLQPNDLVEFRFRDTSGETPVYYALDDPNLNPENGNDYVLWDKLRGQPITSTIHVPTGDEDPELDWLKKIPALADILANNTTGLATVLSSLFGDVDPLTGTTKYYLHNDWAMSTDDGTSGPAIINKPKIVGGYEEFFKSVLAFAEKYNLAGEEVSESPGYFSNLNVSDTSYGQPIAYAHTEITTSETFSGGDYNVDYTNWQLVDYTTPNINLKIGKLLIAPQDVNQAVSQQNQDKITVVQNGNTILVTSTEELNSFMSTNTSQGSGKWIGIDIDTGFRSIFKLKWNGYTLTEQDELEADSVGLPRGHIIFWVKAEDIATTARSITISATSFNDATFTIQYKKISG